MPASMNSLVGTLLRPTPNCGICTEPFSDSHAPISLPCSHIVGHACMKKWLLSSQRNRNTCPYCRQTVFPQLDDNKKSNSNTPHRAVESRRRASADSNDTEIWKALCSQDAETIHKFMIGIWAGITKLFDSHTRNLHQQQQKQTSKSHRRSPAGTTSPSTPYSDTLPSSPVFTTSALLQTALLPALSNMPPTSPFKDAHNLILAIWNSLSRRSTSIPGVAIPLLRLTRLMASSSSTLPRWLTSIPRINTLFWSANASLSPPSSSLLHDEQISWSHITTASLLDSPRYFPLLHLYVVLISQSLVSCSPSFPFTVPEKEILHTCTRRIGGEWEGRPGREFKDRLVLVYRELRRWQVDLGYASLRGKGEEESVVRGLWGVAAWGKGGGLGGTTGGMSGISNAASAGRRVSISVAGGRKGSVVTEQLYR
ncbi:unnamed protein product [Periconia digitata]|uniref:RING-type domain-containing protein n=1 Tax=Periconia digitata TaxID=1303443 RepID=A0A9W4UI62_9PLEO|nr:unnamed protein product [Periconia digitata]